MYGYSEKIAQQPKTTVQKLVGEGMQYSPMVDQGSYLTNTGVDRISQSLFSLFSTRKSERFFQPEFGTKIYEFLYEPNDFILCDLIKFYAQEEIKTWEDRINAKVDVTVNNNDNVVNLKVIYSIKGDTTTYAFDYAFNREVDSLGGVEIE